MQGFSSYELRYIIVKVLGELPISVEVTKIWYLNGICCTRQTFFVDNNLSYLSKLNKAKVVDPNSSNYVPLLIQPFFFY